jgi:hypothetical protein
VIGSAPRPKPADAQNVSAAYLENSAIVEAYILPLSSKHYFVCGDLQAEEPIWFQIYVFDANRKVIGNGDVRAEIPPGKFCLKIIPISGELSIGSYSVEIIYGHDVIGITNFVIIDR